MGCGASVEQKSGSEPCKTELVQVKAAEPVTEVESLAPTANVEPQDTDTATLKSPNESLSQVQSVPVASVASLRMLADPLVIDARDPNEVEGCKGGPAIDGSVNVPFNVDGKKQSDHATTAEEYAAKLDVASCLPKDKAAPIITHCGAGGRGGKAAAVLKGLGFTNVHNGGSPDNIRAACACPATTAVDDMYDSRSVSDLVADAAALGVVMDPAEQNTREPLFGKNYKHNVMFLCNHNSCRSQMADGWLRFLRDGQSVGVASAGIVGGTKVKEGAIIVMEEVGMDIKDFSSDAMADFSPEDFDVVISCCGCGSKLDTEDKVAWKNGPRFEDWNLDDPPAIDPGDLSEYRRVRDECKAKVVELLKSLD
eukprot:gnl/MRDRNA2_/MRDRNA2_36715_c0_seq1.p1 gnl/MRDRNA2_/MRDRNA2_36715_c0~~gnl/MRDRNA2_/MRDRNA2_36715_c0_seq1.p1  ORF type:complete len:367 (+),score=90.72 gnl/MRDRNA2_/MRDRNA2_36715_c0_seq1:79-1179(+)